MDSFRDRTARVFFHQGEVFRILTSEALEHWRRVHREPFFQRLSTQGRIVATRELTSAESARFSVPKTFAAILSHERIPFVSYPFDVAVFDASRSRAAASGDSV